MSRRGDSPRQYEPRQLSDDGTSMDLPKAAYTVTGEASADALTRMDIGESSLGDILSIVQRIQGAG